MTQQSHGTLLCKVGGSMLICICHRCVSAFTSEVCLTIQQADSAGKSGRQLGKTVC